MYNIVYEIEYIYSIIHLFIEGTFKVRYVLTKSGNSNSVHSQGVHSGNE